MLLPSLSLLNGPKMATIAIHKEKHLVQWKFISLHYLIFRTIWIILLGKSESKALAVDSKVLLLLVKKFHTCSNSIAMIDQKFWLQEEEKEKSFLAYQKLKTKRNSICELGVKRETDFLHKYCVWKRQNKKRTRNNDRTM